MENRLGEWTSSEIAAMLGYRYANGTKRWENKALIDEFGTCKNGVIGPMFDALDDVQGLTMGVVSNRPKVYCLCGTPKVPEPANGGEPLDKRAAAFVLGWLLAKRVWFTATEGAEWTGLPRRNVQQICDVRLRMLPIWRRSRKGSAGETLYVDISE